MTLRLGALLVLTGAVLSFTPWVATIAVGAPMMILGAVLLAVALERILDLTAGPPLVRAELAEPTAGTEHAA
jgi:hypothetical protein